MINNHTDRIAHPDGFVGSIMALEGIENSCTLLNGPLGCKSKIGGFSMDNYKRPPAKTMLKYADEFYFGQQRLPCTYIDDYDYVFGTSEKLEYVFPRIAARGYGFIGVLNSPGASLIGDDLQRYIEWSGITIPHKVIESPNFSQPYEKGWSDTSREIIKSLQPESLPVEKNTINLLGLSIWQKYWQGSSKELITLLGLCGIKVNAVLLAGCTVEQIRQIRKAACNVIVHDELGTSLGEFLCEEYGIPLVASPEGAPVGFDATEKWVTSICGFLSVDPSPALQITKKIRREAAGTLNRFTLNTGYPRAMGFSIVAGASIAYPLLKFCHEYLAMRPLAIQTSCASEHYPEKIKEYLIKNDLGDIMNCELEAGKDAHVIFSSDAPALRILEKNPNIIGIVVENPSEETVQFIQRSLLGPTGAKWLLEDLCSRIWRVCK